MTRGKFVTAAFVAVFAAGVASAEAQRTGAGPASREPSESGDRSGGSAVPRDTGSSGSSGSSVGSSSSSSGSASSPGSSGGGWSAPSSGGSSRARSEYYEAPSHPSERQQTRQRGDGGERPSGNSGGRAVPRDTGSGGAGSVTRGAASSVDVDEAPSRRAVPTYSRPRDGRPATGTAVERDFSRIDRGGSFGYPYYGSGYYGSLYYSPYRRYSYIPGYGFGLGYLYDPLWYDPFYYDGYGYGGAYGGGYGGGYYAGSGRSGYGRAATGSLRLKIKPREAKVYVDGYFVGDVDNFDGLFQRLGIDAGGHKIEVRADGYEPIQFDVLLAPGETVTYKGELKRQ